jgi:hypothetical protein
MHNEARIPTRNAFEVERGAAETLSSARTLVAPVGAVMMRPRIARFVEVVVESIVTVFVAAFAICVGSDKELFDGATFADQLPAPTRQRPLKLLVQPLMAAGRLAAAPRVITVKSARTEGMIFDMEAI